VATQQKLRLAVGTPQKPFSGVWTLIVNKNDVYIGSSKASMGVFKISLHESGVWALATTAQSGATFNGNRRMKQWKRPLEHALGVTRGPSILIPHTSRGPRRVMPGDSSVGVTWFTPPSPNNLIEFSTYIVQPGARTAWDPPDVELADLQLKSGARIVVLGREERASEQFLETVESLLAKNVLQADAPATVLGGSLLWFAESRDDLRIPIVVDLPFRAEARPPGWAAMCRPA
jgi:hypothetical protein